MGFNLRLPRRRSATEPSVPVGMRGYAVGDIHGRLDLLDDILVAIEADIATRPAARCVIVFLGDLVDRGPDSRGVIERLMAFRPTWAKPIYLKGNHEEAFLRSVAGEPEVLSDWLRFGGLECAMSYGLPEAALVGHGPILIAQELKRAVPKEHLMFIEGFYDSFALGDYHFVHAGVRPGVPLAEQDSADLRWIRRGFLESALDHGAVIVHGHTIVDTAQDHGNRIAIDTGAYRSGRLTAVVLEGGARRFLVADRAAVQSADAAPASPGSNGS